MLMVVSKDKCAEETVSKALGIIVRVAFQLPSSRYYYIVVAKRVNELHHDIYRTRNLSHLLK